MYLPVLRSSVGSLLFTVVVLCWGTATEVYAQTDSTLATFLKENVVENTIRFENTDEAVSYLRTLDPGRLRVVRNAHFAKHGYVFNDSTLQAYFDDKGWYEAEDKDVALSSTEEKNVKFIQSLEDRAQSQLDAFYAKFPPCNFPVRVRLVEREGSAAPVGYSTNDNVPSTPGSGDLVDVPSLEILLNENPFGSYQAGCTIAKTSQYRVLLYAKNTASGGGVTLYETVTFDAFGWRRSKRTLLEFAASGELNAKGEMTISRDDEIMIKSTQVRTEFRPIRGEHRRTKRVKRWHRFTIGPDGTLQPFLEDP